MTGSLETYRAKRDFNRTPEPRGGKRPSPAQRARFVVQKHDATRLHYDFRLEHDGVLKSWAVAKGPSLDPHERRLAVEVEDHPLEYGDFEGVIPQGEYGGGTVMLWDRGWWIPEGSVDDGLKKGRLSFRLEGKRMKGGWTLVRMRPDREGRHAKSNWLLIKHDDKAARPDDGDELVRDDVTSVASGRRMEAIAAGRGRAPRPFISDAERPADAVWGSKGNGPPEAVDAPVPARPKGRHGGDAVLGVTISNPDKVLWPAKDKEAAITKIELARYYESVAEWLVPYIRGRPCSIIRTPDGIEGERFFQRHAGPGTSPLITRTNVSGDPKPYLQLDTPEAVIAAAQSGVTELHPWNSLPGRPELPGRLVFDLDPDEALPFSRVTEAATAVRERLQYLGVESFLKSTGGKGLHVVAPFSQPQRKPTGWPEAKTFAQAVCVAMAADSPDAYTTNMAKRARTGRIFLDYLRNDPMASAVALLSPRARPGAPVSMPLAWPRGGKKIDPKAFTLRSAAGLMHKRDPWAGWEEAATPLQPAIEKLARG
jgi:bifunctional non-homologous end joining protein LigD